MITTEEKRNKNVALALSVLIHGLLLLFFIFTMAWRAPNPPLPEYGFELNFGTDPAGSGIQQPLQPSGAETSGQQQPQPEQVPEQEPTPAVDSRTDEKPVDSKLESPVPVKEERKEETKKTERVTEKSEQKTLAKENTGAADKKETPANPLATYTGKPASQGNKPKATGDQGNPEGKPDAKALYGPPGGGGGGPQLNLAGWTWDYIPTPNVPDNESGRIVFKIWVNAEGELERFEVIERSVSLEAERACREALEKLTFTRKDGVAIPAISEGTITFVIRAR